MEWYIYEDENTTYDNSSNCTRACDIDGRVLKTLPITLTSSCLSVIGSILIILPFILWADVRKSNVRRLLFLLAIADFLTAVGFIAAVVKHYMFLSSHNYNDRDNDVGACLLTSTIIRNNSDYLNFCRGQAFVTVYFQCVSFFLTSFIAIYFFIILVFRKPKAARKLMGPFYVTAWGLPLIICGYVMAKKKFGIGDSRSSVAWCFIDNSFLFEGNSLDESLHQSRVIVYFLFEALAEKFWEILTFLIIIVCYMGILVNNRCKKYKKKLIVCSQSSGQPDEATTSLLVGDDPGQWNTANVIINARPVVTSPFKHRNKDVNDAISKADMKLALVPLVFLLLRVWGIIRYFVSMRNGCHIYDKVTSHQHSIFFCIDSICFYVLYHKALLYLHAFGEPGQGFGNAILFVFFSKPIATRLFGPLLKCARKTCPCLPWNTTATTVVPSSVNNDNSPSCSTNAKKEEERSTPRIIITYTAKSATIKTTNEQS